MIALLTCMFVISGAAGLIYESIWSRYLSLFVGHSAYAQIIVLVIFLGGMSLGALLAGRWSARLRQPLLWYAVVEAAVGVIGMSFHVAFRAVSDSAYDTIFPALAGGPLVAVAKWLLAALLILPQSVLLGATFPLMTAGAIRLRPAAAGRLLGLLYFANSLGAASGVLVAGFVLLAMVGLPGTLVTAAVMNLVVAIVVVAGLRASAGAAASPRAAANAPEPLAADGPERAATAASGTRSLSTLLLAVSFGTAVASFVYEIAWVRMLSLVLGSATHSFELMLSAFILGLALGAYWIRGRVDRIRDPIAFLGVVQWVMGALAIATLPLYLASFDWMAALLDTFRSSDAGYRGFVLARYAICLVVMLPATFCAGTTLPLITHILMRGAGAVRGERAIGAVYGVNTIGSIAGVLLAGLVLMPALGLKLLLIAGALVDIALGVALLAVTRAATTGARRLPRTAGAPRLVALAVTTVAVVTATAVMIDFDPLRLTSGVYRYATMPRPGDVTIPFYADGRTATVSIRRTRAGFITLSTNGKPDASMDAYWRDTTRGGPPRPLENDIATQFLLPVVTLAHRPDARDVAVIGLGSGMSSHVLLGSPNVQRLVTIEIEPEMVEAARAFLPANHRVYDDPRARFVLDDAKSFFAASGRRFDLILSEPSNPWVSGVSGLFTSEFYRRVRGHLAPGGVFGQWMHLYELNDPLALTVLAALDRNFRSYEIFFVSNADILIVASNEPALPEPAWRVVDFPGIAHDLRRGVPFVPNLLDATRLGGRQLLHPYLAADVPANSDYHPVLDLGAERSRYLHENAEGLIELGRARFDIAAAIAGRRRDFSSSWFAVTPEIARIGALAVGARLGAGHGGAGPLGDTALVHDEMAMVRARARLDALNILAGGSAPPTNWRLWVDDVRDAERSLHAGTAGVADERFFARLEAYAGRAAAPAPARAALDFLHALAAWRFSDASRAGQVLVDVRKRDSIDWLPPATVRNGLVVARLQLGDLAGARDAFHAYARNADEDALTARILAAYLLDQERRRVE